MKKVTINLTRDGLSSISKLIKRTPYLSRILDGSSHFTENCDWGFDNEKNRNTYQLHLPVDKLDILLFIFESELNFKTRMSDFWKSSYQNDICEKMLNRIVKAIKK